MHQVPIPLVTSVDKSLLIKLVKCATNKAKIVDVEGLRKTEYEIDKIVYRLFEMTPNEIAYIEKSLANTQSKRSVNKNSEVDV